MKHLSEEEMILHYYREDADRTRTSHHLQDCPGCRRSYDSLETTLNTVDPPTVPELAPDFEDHFYQKLLPRLKAHDRPPWLRPWRWPAWATAMAMASAIILAFVLGRYSSPPESTTRPSVEDSKGRFLVFALTEHLERSQRILTEILNGPETKTLDLSEDQRVARDLVAANRLYRQTASRAGESAMESVLEELERFLTEIALGPSKLSPEDAEEFRRRIRDQDIVFRMRVFGAKLQEQEDAAVRESIRGRT